MIVLVSINQGLSISGNLPNAIESSAYVATLEALNGVAPYAWSLAKDSTLPTGLSIATDSNGDGTISGTPTVAGSYSFRVLVRDARGVTATRDFRIIVQ